MGPLITLKVHDTLRAALRAGTQALTCSVDLDRSTTTIGMEPEGWTFAGQRFPWLDVCKERTVYHWTGESFQPISRFGGSLIKLVPTEWGPPTFEIDGIKMLPTLKISPYTDAQRKVALIQPRGKVILDTCGGLGYFAAWCLEGQAAQVLSFEKNPDVIWLRSLNPWSPVMDERCVLTQGDITRHIVGIGNQTVDAILHDPPRFGIAGELYSQDFYDQLARVLKRRGKLFHYTGTPNKLTSGRDVPAEVMNRLRHAGFSPKLQGDGILATRQ